MTWGYAVSLQSKMVMCHMLHVYRHMDDLKIRKPILKCCINERRGKYSVSLSEAVTLRRILVMEQWMSNRVGHSEFQTHDPSIVTSFTAKRPFCN